MRRALALYGHEAEVEPQLVDGADIFDGEDVVRRADELRGVLSGDGCERLLPCGGKGGPALELTSQLRREFWAQQRLSGALQGRGVPALAADAEAVHDAE